MSSRSLLLLLAALFSSPFPPTASSPINPNPPFCEELWFTSAVHHPLTYSSPSSSVLFVSSGVIMEGGGGPEEVPRVPTAGLTCRVSYKTSELRMEEEAGEGWETAREMEAIPAYIFRKEGQLLLAVSDVETAYRVIHFLNSGIVLEYYCGDVVTCYHLRVDKDQKVRLNKRSLGAAVQESHAHSPSKAWSLPALGVIGGLVLLTAAVLMCVKSSSPNEQLLQPNSTGTLRILSGPPPEYFKPPPIPDGSRPHSATLSNPGSLSRGGGGVNDKPLSPSSLSSEDKNRSFSLPGSPGHQSPRKKLATPLPEVPKLASESHEGAIPVQKAREKEEEKVEDEEEEDPYDYAKFDDSINRDVVDSPPSSKSPPPGGYAVVTRHSDNSPARGTTNYSEVRQVGGASRGRSSTDPVELPPPPPPLHSGISRTYTEGGAQPPLPLPPRNFNVKHGGNDDEDKDGMYDSIENLKKPQKLYDSLDKEDDNEMYESVPEDIKEEILSSSAPSRNPRYHDNAPSPSSPSPTKVPRIVAVGTPDSPKSKSRKGRQRPESTSDEAEKGGHNRLSFFNRIRSSSTSATVGGGGGGGGGKREVRKGPGEGGSHLDLPHPPSLPPLPPQPNQLDDEDDEDDTYDSVRPTLTSPKSATLPATKSTSIFSSRVKEPLPEVPEDSGSGSAAIVVERERIRDKSDPDYDTVRKEEEEEGEKGEPDYDTVKRSGTHNYAKVTSHGDGGGPVSHDSEGYARVDPQIVERKRAFSQSKMKEEEGEEEGEEEEEEDPYDRVKDLEPGYTSVKELLSDEATSGTPTQSEPPPTQSESSTVGADSAVVDSEVASPTHSLTDPEMAYAIIDPKIVERKRAESMGSKNSNAAGSKNSNTLPVDTRSESTSPVPPIPPVGDLGDISEFDPPPIPEQSLDGDDLLSPSQSDTEDPYSKVGAATKTDTPNAAGDSAGGDAKEKVGVSKKEEMGAETSTLVIRDSVLSSESSEGGVPVYDSLEPQTPLYDSLDPTQPSLPPSQPSLSPPSSSNQQQPTYDSLLPDGKGDSSVNNNI